MSFLAPYMFWGVFAVGIPIALHFFYRSRYRTVPWAAMKFLLMSIEQTSRRLRFQELLLLLLRVAVLLLLVAALMRPTTSKSGASSRGDAVDAVLVIDTSLSMAARDGSLPPRDSGNDPYLLALRKFAGPDGSLTRLDRAKAAALAVVANLPPHSTVQVITSADRAVLLGPQVPSHLDQARELIEKIEGTHLGTDFLPGVSEAQAALQRGHSPNKELYLFSDMQKTGWEQQSAPLTNKLKEISEQATIHLVHCATRTPANVAITGITPQSGLRTGERADFAVNVRNSGKEAVHNLTVTLEINGRTQERDAKPVDTLPPGETRAVVLTGLLIRPGRQVITATVQPDDLDADNRFDQVIQVNDQVGILVVDGSPNDRDPLRAGTFFLQHALNPRSADVATPLPVRVVSPEHATPKELANKDLCVLVNVALQPTGKEEGRSLPPEFVKSLTGFVREGHGLLIFAGDRVDPESYNQLLYEQHRLLPMKIGAVTTTPDGKPLSLDRRSAEGQPFGKARQDDAYGSLDKLEVRQTAVLQEPPRTGDSANPLEEVRVLLRYTNGWPAVVSKKKAGEGEVVLFASTLVDYDPQRPERFKATAYFLLVQMSLGYLLESQPSLYNRVAGEPLRWHPPKAGGVSAYDLIRPDGTRVRLGYPEITQGPPVLTAGETFRGGIYYLARTDGLPALGEGAEELGKEQPGVAFAVVPDLRETEDLESLKESQLKAQLDFKVVQLTAGDDGKVFSGAERLKREWTVWLLVAVLVLTLGESVLAWFCGRAW